MTLSSQITDNVFQRPESLVRHSSGIVHDTKERLLATSNEVVVYHKVGLHARPAAIFAKTASEFSSTILVENLTKGSQPVNAKSVLRILSIGIQMDDRLRITAVGSDERAAISALSNLIAANFGEME